MSESQINNFSRRSLLRFSAAGAVAVGGGAVLSACGGGQQSLTARVEAGNPVRLGIANEPPYTVLNADGTLTGAAPDVAKAVLKHMGIGADQVKPVQTKYASMIPGLKANRLDMVTAGLFMNEKRCSQVVYSDPVLVAEEAFAMPPDNPKGVKTIKDAKDQSDFKIAVLQASFELAAAKSAGVPGSQLEQYPLAPKALDAMAAGRVDAVLLPKATLELARKNRSGDFAISLPLESVPTPGSGAAFSPDDKQFFNDYNKQLKALKQTSEFDSILDKWGFPPDKARKFTNKELCDTSS